MIGRIVAVLAVAAAMGGCQSGGSGLEVTRPPITASMVAFDRIKGLEGNWEGKGQHGEANPDVKASYEVTSGGSAVVETLFPGTENEMVTVYTLDLGGVAMTHYCMLGNQPHLRLTSAEGNVYRFVYVTGGNMASRDQMHMDSMVMTMIGSDRLTTDWTSWADGKPTAHALFDLRRVSGPGHAAK